MKPHILQVTILRFPEIEGGIDSMVNCLVAGLRPEFKVSVLLPDNWQHRALSRRQADDIDVYSLYLRYPYDNRRPIRGVLGWLFDCYRIIRDLLRLTQQTNVDVIHIHCAKSYLFYFRILRMLGGPPYVITIHGTDIAGYHLMSRFARSLVKWTLNGAERLIAVSRWLASQAKNQLPELGTIDVVYNGLDFARIRQALTHPPDFQIPLPSDYCLMVGSLDPYKGHDLVIRAWGQVIEKAPDLHLVLVGDGELFEEYSELIRAHGCQNRIHLLGQLSHETVIGLMSRARTLIFPSRREGLPYVLLEAGYVGLPVICSAIEPFLEVTNAGAFANVFPLDDDQALVKSVLGVFHHPDSAERKAQDLRKHIIEKFSSAAMVQNYVNAYREVLAFRKPCPAANGPKAQ